MLFPDGQWRRAHRVGHHRSGQKCEGGGGGGREGEGEGEPVATLQLKEGEEDEEVLLINIGDLFQQWTNDRWKSTMHRVGNPEPGTAAARSDRLSLVFVTGPRDDALIEVLPCCRDDLNNPPRYAPVRAGDHLMTKLGLSNV